MKQKPGVYVDSFWGDLANALTLRPVYRPRVEAPQAIKNATLQSPATEPVTASATTQRNERVTGKTEGPKNPVDPEVEALISALQEDEGKDEPRNSAADTFKDLTQEQHDAIELDEGQSRFKALITDPHNTPSANWESPTDLDADLWLLLEAQKASLRSARNARADTETYSAIDKSQRLEVTVSRLAGATWNVRVQTTTRGPKTLKIRWKSGAEQSFRFELVQDTTRVDVEAPAPADRPISVQIR